jgi:predicted phage gp36 major capsid-like protein
MTAEPTRHRTRRRRGQRNQQHERGETDGDERTLADVLQDRQHVEPLVEPHVRCEVQRRVKEREQPDHPAKAQQRGHARHAPQRRDSERGAEDHERPPAGGARDEFDRVRAEPVGQPEQHQTRERIKADRKHQQPGRHKPALRRSLRRGARPRNTGGRRGRAGRPPRLQRRRMHVVSHGRRTQKFFFRSMP